MTYIPEEKVSIIVAAYNEEGNVGMAIEKIKTFMPKAEIVIVDDGSTDDTFGKAKKYENDLIKVIHCAENKGKGRAIRTGVNHSTGCIMAQIDADLQFPVEGLEHVIQPIVDNKADITFGTRYLTGSGIEPGSITFLKRAASFTMGWLITLITQKRYTDVFSGLKAWKSECIRDIDLKEDNFTYEAEIAIKAKWLGYKVIEVQTPYCRRIAGESKIRLLYHTVVITFQIFRLTFFTKKRKRV